MTRTVLAILAMSSSCGAIKPPQSQTPHSEAQMSLPSAAVVRVKLPARLTPRNFTPGGTLGSLMAFAVGIPAAATDPDSALAAAMPLAPYRNLRRDILRV